jgi:hypothetical protein
LELRNQRKDRQIKAGRPKPNADGHPSAAADFCNKIGTNAKWEARRAMSEFEGKAEDIYSG